MQMVEIVHHILSEKLAPGDRAVDATVGNGWDTLKMCEIVGATGDTDGGCQPKKLPSGFICTGEKIKFEFVVRLRQVLWMSRDIIRTYLEIRRRNYEDR